MKKLTEADVIRLMREEWDARVNRLAEAVDATLTGKVDGKNKTLISKDLKLRHKKTQILYTVMSVGTQDVVLKTPEGKNFIIDKVELEKEYEVD